MATRRRDYQKDAARRNAIARAYGWRSYGARRYAKQQFKKASLETKAHWARFLTSDKGQSLSKEEQEKAFRAFYLGIANPKTNRDVSITSPKAEWFVEWWEAVPDYEVWKDRYARS